MTANRSVGPVSSPLFQDAKTGTFLGGGAAGDDSEDDDVKRRLSKEDYNYWRHLAKVLYDEEQKRKEEDKLLTKQSENIQLICEELEYEKNILRKLKVSTISRMASTRSLTSLSLSLPFTQMRMNEMERLMQQTQI